MSDHQEAYRMLNRVQGFLDHHLNTTLTMENNAIDERVSLKDDQLGNDLEVLMHLTGNEEPTHLYIRLLHVEGHSLFGFERDFRIDDGDDAIEWIGQSLIEMTER